MPTVAAGGSRGSDAGLRESTTRPHDAVVGSQTALPEATQRGVVWRRHTWESLLHLDLSFNRIVNASEVFGKGSPVAALPNLRELHVAGNGMAHVPSVVAKFRALRVLCVDDNRFGGEDVANLASIGALYELYCAYNVVAGLLPSETEVEEGMGTRAKIVGEVGV